MNSTQIFGNFGKSPYICSGNLTGYKIINNVEPPKRTAYGNITVEI